MCFELLYAVYLARDTTSGWIMCFLSFINLTVEAFDIIMINLCQAWEAKINTFLEQKFDICSRLARHVSNRVTPRNKVAFEKQIFFQPVTNVQLMFQLE